MNKKFFSVLGLISVFGVSATALAETPVKTDIATVPGQASTTDLTEYTQYKFGDAATVKFNALLQGWAVGNANTTANDQNLRLRRAELKLSGVIAGAPKYFFMVDPAKLIVPPNGKSISADNMIQDFGMTYAIVPGLELTAGQFKTPTTAEGLDPASDLPLPERSVVGRTYGDKREMGVKLAYKTAEWNVASMVSSGRPIYVNGTGAFNDLDARFEYTPTKQIMVGTFAVIGNSFDYSKKGRWGLNGRYNIGDAVLRAEYSQGKDGAVQGHGVTTEAGYWLTENLEPVARFETFSPNQSFDTAAKAETLGVNYYFRNYFTKVQVAGTLMQDMAAINGSPSVAKGVTNQEVTLELQAAI